MKLLRSILVVPFHVLMWIGGAIFFFGLAAGAIVAPDAPESRKPGYRHQR